MNGSKKWYAPLIGAIGLLCATAAAVAASGSSNANYAGNGYESSHPGSKRQLAARVLRLHNAERADLGLEPLKWNVHLEREAQQWARFLARRGILQHADRATRNGAGENLWMGTAGSWPVEGIIGMFLREKKHYRHAAFPNTSNTGRWSDVGHYTQIVWRDTREVGCAIATARGHDVLVCRYWPAGNVWGRKAY